MKLENQVCSLELAKRLKELGVKQESLWWWCELSDGKNRPSVGFVLYDNRIAQARVFNCPELKIYSAFTVAELGERLPPYIKRERKWYRLYTWKANNIRYECLLKSEEYGYSHSTSGNTEANARAKMLIYLLENKLI